MNYQETELLMAVILIIVMEGVFLACGGFETIKEAMQAAGGTIWNMISWPWRWHKQKKQIEQERQQAEKGTVKEMEEQGGEKQWRDHIMDRFMRVT